MAVIDNSDFQAFIASNYIKNSKGRITKNNRPVSPSSIYETYTLYAVKEKKSLEGVSLDSVIEMVDQWIEEAEKQRENKAAAATVPYTNLIATYLDNSKDRWQISPSWDEVQLISPNGKCPMSSNVEELARYITVWANERGFKASFQQMKMFLLVRASEKKSQRLSTLFGDIGYDPTYVAKCDETIKDIWELLAIEEDLELFSLLLKHWIWLVKRKLLGKETVWEMWLNFFGAAGVGKSTLLRKLCSLIEEFYDEPEISIFADATREREKLTRMYVLNFEELNLGEKINFLGDDSIPKDVIRGMKKYLTQKKGSFRNLGGQEQTKMRMTFSAISSANDHLYDIVFDEKTMRRYFEFHCTRDKSKLDKNYYNHKDEIQKNLVAIWKGVDEFNDDGYLNISHPLFRKVQEIQDAYYPTDTTTSKWISDQNVVAGLESDTLEIYRDYSRWCKERGYMPRSQAHWMKDVQHYIPNSKTLRRNINIGYAPSED